MLRVLMYILPIALAIYAIADISRTDDANIKLMPKWAWFLIAILVGIVGPISWLIAGKNRYRRPPKRQGPKGPDDDPDFLKGL
ncbi:MAG: PLD nuclease N-terminal domain-containing protein [Candidatus Nanopelagicaceae bacterium]